MTEVRAPVIVAVAADSCAACGVQLAPDQRYCVECGHSRGTARMPAFASAAAEDGTWSDGGSPAGSALTPRSSGRWWRPAAWRSANPTVFALIGALLLAIGVGVLIGRSNGPSSVAGSRVTTVFLQGPGASVGTAAPTAVAPTAVAPPPAATTPTHGAAAAAAAKKAAAGAAAAAKKAAKTPPPKAATVGSAGSGPGYQKGKFTGNFFGGG